MLYSLSDWISYVWSGSHHFSLSGNPHFTRLVCFDSNGCWSWLWIRTTHIAFLMTSSWTLLLHGLHILKVCIFCQLLGKHKFANLGNKWFKLSHMQMASLKPTCMWVWWTNRLLDFTGGFAQVGQDGSDSRHPLIDDCIGAPVEAHALT